MKMGVTGLRYYVTCKDEEDKPIVLLAKADSEEMAVEKVISSYKGIKEVISVETKRPQLRKGTVSSSFTLLKDWGCVKVRRASRGGKSWPSFGE